MFYDENPYEFEDDMDKYLEHVRTQEMLDEFVNGKTVMKLNEKYKMLDILIRIIGSKRNDVKKSLASRIRLNTEFEVDKEVAINLFFELGCDYEETDRYIFNRSVPRECGVFSILWNKFRDEKDTELLKVLVGYEQFSVERKKIHNEFVELMFKGDTKGMTELAIKNMKSK